MCSNSEVSDTDSLLSEIPNIFSNIEIERRNGSECGVYEKRKDYLSWTDMFMSMALLISKRSKDPCSQVGACIVNKENKIVGLGYNGMPTGCSDDEFPWSKFNTLDGNKHLYVCHAEMNAVLNNISFNVQGCTMYVVLFPCNECAKIIIQAGIKEIIFLSDKHSHKVSTMAAKRMFDAANVMYRQYVPKINQLVIDFSSFHHEVSTDKSRNGISETLKSSSDVVNGMAL